MTETQSAMLTMSALMTAAFLVGIAAGFFIGRRR
jgi:hypothetical protein